jgi:dihydropteroate synthase
MSGGCGWIPLWRLLWPQAGCPIVVMHNRSKPKDVAQEQRLGGHYIGIHYDDVIGDIHRELEDQIGLALNAGVAEEQIIIDPGIGFGKTVEQNLELLDRLGELKSLRKPILIGPSRKSFIGYTLDLPPEDRVEGSAAAVAIGIDRGADIIRVHDVRAMARVARLTDSIVRRKLSSVN